MPRFDQKGPAGQGPMTGRRMGKCTNFGAIKTYQTEEKNQIAENLQENPHRGLGLGRGVGRRGSRGRGLGMQNGFRGGQ
jgi:hypothetical protein